MRSLTLTATLFLIAAVAGASTLTDTQNAIGIFHPLPDDVETAQENRSYVGAPGTFQAYAVLINPTNDNTGGAITTVGGFEFRLELPGNVFLMGSTLPPMSTNFLSPPDFYVGSSIPVSNNMCTLVTLDFGEFSGAASDVYLSPVSEHASLPGAMAIADADDGFSLSEAFPASGNYASPVFRLYWVEVLEDASWGEVKALFRE